MIDNILKEIDELQKKINNLRPLTHDELKQVKEYYRIGLTYSSNALEGNSLTESETKVVLEDGITVSGKPLKDHFEALGHAEAYDLLYSLVNIKNISEDNIKQLHKLFYLRINEKEAGKYRQARSLITGSKYSLPMPEEIPQQMKEFILKVENLRQKNHPVIVSSLMHKEFVFIHPFIDGNGRVARLLMNLILLQEGYNIAIISPILRLKYIQTLEKAHTNDNNFIELIAETVKETQKDYLRLLK